MAVDLKPSTWLPAGYALSSHKAEFNTNDASSGKLLTRIVDAEADPTTGDIRKLFFALCEMMYQAWLTIAADITNLPGRMRIKAVNSTADSGRIHRTYTIEFDLDPTDTPVADE